MSEQKGGPASSAPDAPKRRGRPKGLRAPLTAAEKMRRYRRRKKAAYIKAFELSTAEVAILLCALEEYGRLFGDEMKGKCDSLTKKLTGDLK